MQMRLSKRSYPILLATSAALVLCGLLILAYILWPLEISRANATLAPTLFVPPP
jgi:hypothetical protein